MQEQKTVNFILLDNGDELPPLPAWPMKRRRCRAEYPANWQVVSWLIRRVAGQRCVWCGSSERLQVHHMGVDYPNGRAGSRRDKHDLRVENLYALCGQCHAEIETWLRQWEEDRMTAHRALGVGVGIVVYTG